MKVKLFCVEYGAPDPDLQAHATRPRRSGGGNSSPPHLSPHSLHPDRTISGGHHQHFGGAFVARPQERAREREDGSVSPQPEADRHGGVHLRG